MTTFLDLLPGGEKVAVPGGEVDAVGVSIEGLGALVLRFPEVVDQLFAGKINAASLVVTVPKAVAVFIAAGMGCMGDEKAEQWAARLPLWAQVDLCAAIIRQTMGSDDSGPFVDRLMKMAKLVGLEARLKNLQGELQQPVEAPAEAPSPLPLEPVTASASEASPKRSARRLNTSSEMATPAS